MYFPLGCLLITIDVQAVTLAPFIRANSMYYKSKRCIHNISVQIKANNNVTCFLGDEMNIELVSPVYASMITNYIYREIEYNSTLKKI